MTTPILERNAQIGDPVIIAPRLGDPLQGVVTIIGSSDIAGFVSAEISFTYNDDLTGTWFLIATDKQPVFHDRLATWDTTVISDGNYILRLRIYLSDGSTRDALVSSLRVRNYTPVETTTPIPLAPEATPSPSFPPSETPYPTPTALARNPATIAPTDVSISILYGGLAAVLIFIILCIYVLLRRN